MTLTPDDFSNDAYYYAEIEKETSFQRWQIMHGQCMTWLMRDACHACIIIAKSGANIAQTIADYKKNLDYTTGWGFSNTGQAETP